MDLLAVFSSISPVPGTVGASLVAMLVFTLIIATRKDPEKAARAVAIVLLAFRGKAYYPPHEASAQEPGDGNVHERGTQETEDPGPSVGGPPAQRSRQPQAPKT